MDWIRILIILHNLLQLLPSVQLGSTGSDWVRLGSTGFDCVRLGSTGFSTGFDWVSTEFGWVQLGSTGIDWDHAVYSL